MSMTYEDVMAAVVVMAGELFEDCGSPDDFCIQAVGSSTIVFGGTNRVTLSKHGWRIDEGCCTTEFKKRWYSKSRALRPYLSEPTPTTNPEQSQSDKK